MLRGKKQGNKGKFLVDLDMPAEGLKVSKGTWCLLFYSSTILAHCQYRKLSCVVRRRRLSFGQREEQGPPPRGSKDLWYQGCLQ